MSLSPIHPTLFYRKAFFSFQDARVIFSLIFLFYCLGSCTTTTKDLPNIPSSDVIQYKKALSLRTTIAELPLRNDPDASSDLIEILPKGSFLKGVAYSDKAILTKQINGITYKEPWLKVSTEDGKMGWVFSGGLLLNRPIIPTVAQSDFLQKRLNGIFGTDLSKEILQYRKTYKAISTSQNFAAVYTKGLSLRDSVAQVLSMAAEVVDPYEPADFSWLEYTLPGFRVQLVAEATAYYPYINYASFLEKANATFEKEDDLFLQLNIAMYKDSMEQAFPSWVQQTWDYGGHSLLGSNKHLELLASMDAIYQQTSLFNSHLTGYKDALLSDILAEWVTYWDTQASIQKELKQIISSKFSCLTEEEQLQLQQRLVAFGDPSQHNISLNNKN